MQVFHFGSKDSGVMCSHCREPIHATALSRGAHWFCSHTCEKCFVMLHPEWIDGESLQGLRQLSPRHLSSALRQLRDV
jgi:hypothetical protein